jgi:hypothetical protein
LRALEIIAMEETQMDILYDQHRLFYNKKEEQKD